MSKNIISETFEEITKEIWHGIDDANRYKLTFGEETITDLILLKLVKKNYFNLRILQTLKPLEAKKGTDWEWIVGTNTYGWIRFAVQAKKMNRKTAIYDKLNHLVGKPPHEDYQINILRTFATANGAVPLYQFYNYYPAADRNLHWQCHLQYEQEMLGWTFTTLTNVDRALRQRGARNFTQLHQQKITLPVRCLFNCPRFKSYYRDTSIIGRRSDILGEPFTKLSRLPDEFLTAREGGVLPNFPEELYNPEINIYPERIAIIELSEEEIKTANETF